MMRGFDDRKHEKHHERLGGNVRIVSADLHAHSLAKMSVVWPKENARLFPDTCQDVGITIIHAVSKSVIR